jgi:hypothetical protein
MGVAAAVISALTAVAWMPYYPIWSCVYVGIAGLVTYALTVHGGSRVGPSAYPSGSLEARKI